MGDNTLPFLIFTPFYILFLHTIAQDVIDGSIPEKWHKKIWYWFTSFGITWGFGVIPSLIIVEIFVDLPDPFYATLALFPPLFGAILAAAVGFYVRSRDSEDKPAAAP
ncbi:hypothetical protein [Pseudomonas serbica]|jgi:hypothetical protein|uniref:hypothetical protein n=1 Tax=Pseudomonas serbica TaxID=2965074 RepID=UPI00237B1EF3|nr:hypothetical protein [Pseudomonas serbica]